MRNFNFFLLIIGRLVTNIGDSLYSIAGMWLVFELTRSPFYTGLAGFLISIPIASQFLIGPLIDKWNQKLILIFTQITQAILLLFIPLAYYLNILEVWIVLFIMPIIVLVQQFVYPTQSAVLPKIVKEEELVKANTLMTLTYQGSDIIFTALSGLILLKFGAIKLLMIASIFFLTSTIIFLFLKLPIKISEFTVKQDVTYLDSAFKDYLNDLKNGYTFIRKSFIPKFLIASIIANFMLGAVTANLPTYAFNRGGESYYGYYLSSLAGGMLIGALVTPLFSKFPLGKLTIYGFMLSGCSWLIAAFIDSTMISIIFFGLSQVVFGLTNILFLSVLQRLLPEAFLGRVFTFIGSVAMIATPLGSLSGGIIITMIGSEKLLYLGAIATFFISIYWFLSPILRSIPSAELMDAKKYGLIYEEKLIGELANEN